MSDVVATLSHIFDLALRLAPAASIIAAIVAARIAYRNNRRLNAEVIAKNHYREMLEMFWKNTDILRLGSNADSFESLKKDTHAYRRYRMLFTIMSFAMQELYFAMDLDNEKNWEQMIRVFISLFKYFILSEEDFPPYMQQTLNPRFLAFMLDTAAKYEHPAARMDVSRYFPSNP